MKYSGTRQRVQLPRLAALAALVASCLLPAVAQRPVPRLKGAIDDSARAVLAGSRLPAADARYDAGAVPAEFELQGMTLAFQRSSTQEAALKTLIAAQQDPKSPLYHHWLTTAQFAARFGVASADLNRAQAWLESHGFAIEATNNARTEIHFGGNAGQVAQAFGAPLHYYAGPDGKKHFAPSAELTLPAALAGIVGNVGNLSSFKPRPAHINAHASFTSGQTGDHFLTPGDISTIYGVGSTYNGAGQSIAIMGQSAVNLSDIQKFQSAVGIAAQTPVTVLVPDTGSGFQQPDDESESDLDLEYSGSMAPGASLFFVYTGVSDNSGVFDSTEFAIDTNIAPIVSISYGACEAALTAADFSQLDGILEQGATQGQSVIAASGDEGSTTCYPDTSLSTTLREGLSVSFPASSAYVTGIGGTEIVPADAASSNTTYWTNESGTDVISSAKSYIPEMVWNDDGSTSLSSGGGGTSTFEARPSWQTGVVGIPAGTFRLVPDVSLDSANDTAPYLYCSSDPATGVSGSCAEGLRASDGMTLTAAGGTSFATPIFAGMLALINQATNANGQGVVSPILYTLASDPATYATVFHDITSGSNACPSGDSYCSSAGASAYDSTTGYDEASGLGSFDFNALVSVWPVTSTLNATSTTLSPTSTAPATGAADTIIVTVAAQGTSAVVPTGTVTFVVNGVTPGTVETLAAGQTSYTFTSTLEGANTVTAEYSGDANYAPSTGTTIITYPEPAFTLTASDVTVAAGATGTSTVSIQSIDNYAGTITWQIGADASLPDTCVSIPSVTVGSNAATTTTLTIATNSASSVCTTGAVKVTNLNAAKKPVKTAGSGNGPARPGSGAPAAFSLAGLMLLGLLAPKAKRIRPLLAIACLGLLSFGVTACGGSGSSSTGTGTGGTGTTGTNETAGTYTLYLIGTDQATKTVATETQLTLTIN